MHLLTTRDCKKGTAAADEVDDFQSVAIFKHSAGPAVAGSDFEIEFDGDAVGLHVQGFDQGSEGELGGRWPDPGSCGLRR